MPQPRVKFIVRPETAGGLTTFRQLVATELAQWPGWRAHVDTVEVDDVGPFRVAEVQFAQGAHAAAFRQWVVDHLTEIRALVRGVVKAYRCSHDDPEVFSCTQDPRSQYSEVRL